MGGGKLCDSHRCFYGFARGQALLVLRSEIAGWTGYLVGESNNGFYDLVINDEIIAFVNRTLSVDVLIVKLAK